MRAELRLLCFEASYGTGYSVVHTRRADGLHRVVITGLRIESQNAHPENHVRMGSVAPIGRLGDLRQVRGFGAIVYDAVVQVGASGICRSPANNRHTVSCALELGTRCDLCDFL